MAQVLVIDDEPEVRNYLRLALEAAGHQVREAADGAAGLAAFRAERPDLVLCDLFMPGRDGFETLRDIRAECPTAKVMVVSGGGGQVQGDFLGHVKALGACDTLAKPFTPEGLLDAINRALGA